MRPQASLGSDVDSSGLMAACPGASSISLSSSFAICVPATPLDGFAIYIAYKNFYQILKITPPQLIQRGKVAQFHYIWSSYKCSLELEQCLFPRLEFLSRDDLHHSSLGERTQGPGLFQRKVSFLVKLLLLWIYYPFDTRRDVLQFLGNEGFLGSSFPFISYTNASPNTEVRFYYIAFFGLGKLLC